MEVCKDGARPLFSARHTEVAGQRTLEAEEAFFDLIPNGNSLLASSTDGIYQIGPTGGAKLAPYLQFKNMGGFSVSFDRTDGVLIDTGRPLAAGGAAVLFVPR